MLVATYLLQVGFGLTQAWALSADAVRQGRWWTLFTHMAAHGGVIHLAFNLSALAAFGTEIVTKTRSGGRALGPLVVLFLLCGLAGAALFLALHASGGPGAVGASGAIFGFWGVAARLTPDGGVWPLFAPAVRAAAVQALVANLILIVPLAFVGGGIAWEAHLGGFLAGLTLAPAVARRARRYRLPGA